MRNTERLNAALTEVFGYPVVITEVKITADISHRTGKRVHSIELSLREDEDIIDGQSREFKEPKLIGNSQ